MSFSLSAAGVRIVLLDIEGTTTPIAFVQDGLFPFARRHLRRYLQEHGGSSDVLDAIRRLREEWAGDAAPPPWSDDPDLRLSSVAGYVEWLMDRDRKSPGLKLLQGYIWERGYRSGALKGEVFPDVAPAIQAWRRSGIPWRGSVRWPCRPWWAVRACGLPGGNGPKLLATRAVLNGIPAASGV